MTDLITAGIGITIVVISMYFIYRNSRTHTILINIMNEINLDIQMINSKEESKRISNVLKKLMHKDRYTRMLFSFKPFTKLEYELRKDIGMPKA